MTYWDIPPDKSLATLVDEWVGSLAGQVRPNTARLYRMHWTAHLLPHFGSPEAITTAATAAYNRKRLALVVRKTLLKERSALRMFLDWCKDVGYLDSAPELAPLPRRAKGTRYEKRRRGEATRVEPEEARAIIAALPRWAKGRDGIRFSVRARFELMYETALRPATLDKLAIPEHYSKGADHLVITEDIDKSAFGRRLPLTDRARLAIESVAPESGLVFGRHHYRKHLDRAAARVLDATRAMTFTAYDLRHARITQLAGCGDLDAVAYIAGHRDITTTSIYVHPGLRAAQRLIDLVDEPPASDPRSLAGGNIPESFPRAVRGRGLEPPRSFDHQNLNRPETNSADPSELLANEAVSLARSALEQGSIDADRATAFARAVIGSTKEGLAALAILAGGPHAPRRALELADLVASSAAAAGRAARREGGS